MKYLVFDTETTGMVQWKAPDIDPRQPKLVQFGGILFDASGNEIAVIKTLVQPLAPIEPKAEETHGISYEMAMDMGISNKNMVELFYDLIDIADIAVAHNMAFDSKIMRHAAYNADISEDVFGDTELRCTKEATTKILRIPNPKIRGQYKWPSLQECATYFFKEEIDGAHDAMVDVRMCARVYQVLTNSFEPHELRWSA